MNDKTTKLTTALFIVLFIISLSQVYFVFETESFYFYHLPTSLATIITVIFYVASIFSNNKEINRLYSLLLGGCYFLTVHGIYSTYSQDFYYTIFLWAKEIIITFIIFATYYLILNFGKNKKEFKLHQISEFTLYTLIIFIGISMCIDKVVTLKPGLIIYFLSVIPLVINRLLDKDEPQDEGQNCESLDYKETLREFILANYLDGLEEDQNIKHNLAIIQNREENHMISLMIHNKNDIIINLDYNKIKKIEFVTESKDLKFSKNKQKKREENLSTINFLLKNMDERLVSEQLIENLIDYNKKPLDKPTYIVITYEIKKEKKQLYFYTKEASDIFFETLERTLPFPIEKR